jgi:superfamily II DNA or RNA helicase
VNYQEFISNKLKVDVPTGIQFPNPINGMLFDFQSDIVKWALKRGRAAIFADCGLGKTPMQLEWANHVHEYTDGNILILAPLAVANQTKREGDKFGINVNVCRYQEDVKKGINITNYEILDHFNPSEFSGIVLDESSILKAFTGKTRNQIIESFAKTPFKLACTATPAPNDFMELGNHSEFLGVMSRSEMLSMFFVHDGGDTSEWRLKGHAETEYWKWICSWAVMIRKPSDLGYADNKFHLPPLHVKSIIAKIEENEPCGETLFRMPASTLQERQIERRNTIKERVKICADMVNASSESWLIWCDRNEESKMLKKSIADSCEITGSDSPESKVENMMKFSSGEHRILITKPSICGFGMNFQQCHNLAFVGLSDSYEQYYQAVRRCWRFGQLKDVNCYIITAETEGAVLQNIKRKESDSMKMADEMVKNMHVYNEQNIKGISRTMNTYKIDKKTGKTWIAHLGDSCEIVKDIADNSIHYSIFSPPFASLYTYSNSDRDMGNCKNESDFMVHFKFLVSDLFRITKPGRLVSFHCMNLPSSKQNDGEIGLKDFRGNLIRLFVECGFIFASEVCIWKDPVTSMQRTKAIGLLHKQLVKDSCLSRQGIPDYLVTMRKPGINTEPVSGELDNWCGDDSFKSSGRLSIDIWQRYASPVWMDINPSNTLQKQSAREEKDERHICPLQLDVIERGIELWSNPGDIIFSPFMGIGSEGYVAVKQGRKFTGIELKESYFKQACANLGIIEEEIEKQYLFDINGSVA